MVNEARLQKYVGEVGVRGVVLCSLPGHGSLGPKGISDENVEGGNFHG